MLRPASKPEATAEEPKCVDLELNVLMSIEDVTSRVTSAVKPGIDSAAAERARRAAINDIEKESRDKTGLRSNVIPLYNGGLYHLYRYKRYTDVRLVFAPQKAIAFFGGDPDNFEYPRYDLDICFFRVYENNQPVHVEHYLKWSEAGAAEGDLVFVSGNPGRTERLDTVAHLEFQRDYVGAGSTQSPAPARSASQELLGPQHRKRPPRGRRAIRHSKQPQSLPGNARRSAGSRNHGQEARRRENFAGAVAKDPKLQQAYGDAWDQVAASLKTLVKIRDEYNLLGRGTRPGIQQRSVRHRQDAGAAGGGIRQAQQRAPARIFRSRPRFAEAATYFPKRPFTTTSKR